MSRYNEDEWNRILDEEKSREKDKYRNKLKGRQLMHGINPEQRDLQLYRNAYTVQVEANKKNESVKGIIVVFSLCVIAILASWFAFNWYSESYFYEKKKADVIAAALALKEAENKAENIKRNATTELKRWKRTIWEEYKGKFCKENNSCIYTFEQKWRDCWLETGKCNKTRSRTHDREYYKLKKTEVIYL